MNLKTISCATALALALPAVTFADVTLYGQAHVSVDNLDDGAESGIFLSSNSSRLGVKASTELGEGLKGIAQYETGVNLHDSSSAWAANRDSYVGLSGGFGTLIGGRLPAANQWVYDANLFADQVGDAGNFTGLGLPGRVDHALHYITPEFGGLTVGLTYVPANSTDPDATATMGAKANFKSGGLKTGFVYFDIDEGAVKVTGISAGYDFGAFLVNGIALQADPDGADSSTVVNVGLGLRAAGGMVKAQYSMADETASGANDGATMVAVGYDRPLGQSTTAYVAYASVSNDDNAAFSPNNWGHGENPAVAAGNSPSGFSLGVVYKF